MRTFIITAALLAAGWCSAQEDMSTVWTTKLEFRVNHSGTDPNPGEDNIGYAASDKEMAVYRNKDGSIVWTKPFKEMAPRLKKIDELIPFWESHTIFLFDHRGGADVVCCIDLHSGNTLWTSEKYSNLEEDNVIYIKEKDLFAISTKDAMTMIKARTGEELWSTKVFTGSVGKYIIDGDDMVCVNFVGPGLAALFSGFKNQIARIDLNTGTIRWQNTYIGRAERKIVTRKFVYDLKLDGGKVYLLLNGVQVYDYATGTQQWNAAFDFTPDGICSAPAHAKKFGVYGAVAEPVVDGNDVYVLDCSNRRNQYLKKYDRLSGKLLWTSPEIKDAKCIPGMFVADGRVVLQIGGQVETQAFIYWVERTQTAEIIHREWRVQYRNIRPCGVQAFNTNDGALAWQSERFKKDITNSFIADDRLYICSAKALYCIDHKTGSDIYEVPLGDDGIGWAVQILPYKDKVVIVGEKGVVTHGRTDGKLVAHNKYKSSEMDSQHDNILLMQTDGADLAAFNLDDCSFRQYNARKDAPSELSYDGKYVYVYEKKEISKLRTM